MATADMPDVEKSKTDVEVACIEITVRQVQIDKLRHSRAGPLRRCIAGFLFLVTLVGALDSTMITVALQPIASDFDASVVATFSLGTAFLLSTCIFQPFFSELSHVVGRQPAFLLALIIYATGSVVAASSKSIAQLLIGRVIQGSGSAGCSCLSVIVMTDVFPLRERARWMGYLNGAWLLGGITGPIVGGLIAERNWRIIFWINLPLLWMVFAGFSVLLGYDKPTGGILRSLARVDWLGMFLFVTSAVSFLLALTFGGILHAWSSYHTILPLIFGMFGFFILALQQTYLAAPPMFKARIFHNTPTVTAYLSAGVQGILLWMLLYYMCVYYQGIRGYSGLMTGMFALCETLTIAPVAIATGIYISKTGVYQWAVWVGWALTTTSYGLLCLLRATTSIPVVITINVLLGIGLGLVVPTMVMTAQVSLPEADHAHAVAMLNLLRAAGQCLGVAIGTAIFSNQLGLHLHMLGVDQQIAKMPVVEILNALRGNTLEDLAVMQAVENSLQAVWVAGCVMGAAVFLATVFTKYPPLPEDRGDDDATQCEMVTEAR